MISHILTKCTLFRSCARATLALAIFAAPSAAYAQEASFDFNIAAQDLATALRLYGNIARHPLSFDSAITKGKTSNALIGTYTADDGLRKLLEGTGLQFRRGASGMLLITAEDRGQTAGEYAAGQGPAASANAEGSDREIVVTGTLIRGAAPSGANLIVLGREDLDNTGRGTLAEALQTVPQIHGGGANAATTRTGVGRAPNQFGGAGSAGTFGAASFNLRGLGLEETLTLVNGRRLAPGGDFGAVADIATLPMAAIERVEILADGASATYGADAMAGVVNIIMNRRFEGAETRLRAGVETRSGQPEFQASQTFGWAFDRGNILLSADYARQDGITAKGRPYAASADLRPFGGSDHRLPYCSPGNIVAPSPAELIGAIPAGQDGTALTPEQIRSGETNWCNGYPDNSHLTPETEKASVYLASSYHVTDRMHVSIDVFATQRSTMTVSNYLTSIPFLTVPMSNAYRQINGLHGNTAPFNQDIYIRYLFTEAEPLTFDDNASSLLASVGMHYNIGGNWQLNLSSTYGLYDSKSKSHQLDARPASQGGALSLALASSNPATAFNPFGDGSANSRALAASFLYPYHLLHESDYRSASLSLSGSLLDLPGGPMKLAVGGDYRRENFSHRIRAFYANLAPVFQESYSFDADRDVSAAYAELFIPLFSEQNAVAGVRRLTVSLSGRYDHYSDFGSTFNPKAGITWVPVKGLTLEGSYGTSFKAPMLKSLYDVSGASFEPNASVSGAPDLNGDGLISTMNVFGGNPELGPEEGKSWTVGVEIEPAPLQGLRLRATYFNLRFNGRFAQTYPGQVFGDPAAYEGIAYYPLPSQSQIDSRITSVDLVVGTVPPAASIDAIVDQRTLNFASQVMDGVDAGASYRWDGLGGTFNLSGDVSYLSRYKSRLGRSVSVTSYLDNVGLPTRWKARGGLGWMDGGVSLNGWVNHTASYTNKTAQPYERVPSYTTIDMSAQVRLGGWARDLVGNDASLSFYVTNLLDQAPPFVNSRMGVGYDGANADPIGRRVAVQLMKRW